MALIVERIRNLNWFLVVLLCIIPGLAPFNPPHLIEKLTVLIHGQHLRPIDWFDMVFHGLPWVLAIIKVVVSLQKQK